MNNLSRVKFLSFICVVICLALGVFLATIEEPTKLFAGTPPQQTGPAPTNTASNTPANTPLPTATTTSGTPIPTVVFTSNLIPNLGLVLVRTYQAQPVYENPSGSVVRNSDGSELWIPHDWDHNGFDTYLVTGSASVGSRIWVQIYLGSSNLVWIPLDKALAITILRLD